MWWFIILMLFEQYFVFFNYQFAKPHGIRVDMEVDLCLYVECKTFCIANKKYIFFFRSLPLKLIFAFRIFFLVCNPKCFALSIKTQIYLHRLIGPFHHCTLLTLISAFFLISLLTRPSAQVLSWESFSFCWHNIPPLTPTPWIISISFW